MPHSPSLGLKTTPPTPLNRGVKAMSPDEGFFNSPEEGLSLPMRGQLWT